MSKTEGWNQLIHKAILLGVFLLILVFLFAGHEECMSITELAGSTVHTLKQQCASFDKLTAADRTKSLFRLTDMLQDFSERLAREPELCDDAALENYVDSLRISGIALLDENLNLQASGYTRHFRDANLQNSPDGSHFADIVRYPNKIFVERLEVNGEYYDICAVARKDVSGIAVGFYHQPSGLIGDTENDLESMLTGLYLERKGNYAIAQDGVVRATSNREKKDLNVSDSEVLKRIAQFPTDGKIHLIHADGKHYWGYQSSGEGYAFYLYYPVFTVFSASLVTAAVFAAVYFIVCSIFFALRNQTLYESQQKLSKSNKQLSDTVQILHSLETIYFTLFYVDLEKNRYECIYLSPWLKEKVPLKGIYTELKSMFLNEMVVPNYREEVNSRMSIEFIRETLSHENITDVRKSFYTDYQAYRNGEIKWCRVSATVVDYDQEGQPSHVLALLQDVDEEKAKEMDCLTGVMGRRMFLNHCTQIQKQAYPCPDKKGWFLFIDVDWFKQINDTLGHTVGDETLRQIAENLQKTFIPFGAVGRVGGDEFAVIIEIDMMREELEQKLGDFLENISGLLPERKVSCSIGGYHFVFPREIKELLTETDAALYRAKERGRACFVIQDGLGEAG